LRLYLAIFESRQCDGMLLEGIGDRKRRFRSRFHLLTERRCWQRNAACLDR
uniref:Uncharacterized protein n=1 Tax=Haemonchus placei TaxID=6290 RepID=A0A0N4WF08_HAEPC